MGWPAARVPSLFCDTVFVPPTARVSLVAIRVAVAELLAPRPHAVAVRYTRGARVRAAKYHAVVVVVAEAITLAVLWFRRGRRRLVLGVWSFPQAATRPQGSCVSDMI